MTFSMLKSTKKKLIMLTLVRPTIIYVHINKILFIIIELKS